MKIFCYGAGTTLEDIGWQVYLGLVALLAGSAFFSASETAFATVNTIRLKNYADAGDKKAAMALKNPYNTKSLDRHLVPGPKTKAISSVREEMAFFLLVGLFQKVFL